MGKKLQTSKNTPPPSRRVKSYGGVNGVKQTVIQTAVKKLSGKTVTATPYPVL